jgi:hypothetical protein
LLACHGLRSLEDDGIERRGVNTLKEMNRKENISEAWFFVL